MHLVFNMRFLFLLLLITSSIVAQVQVTTGELLGLPNYGKVYYYSPPGVNVVVKNAPNAQVIQMKPDKEAPIHNPNGIKLDTTLWMNKKAQKGKTIKELFKELGDGKLDN